jgi:hypothetical protein
MNAAQSQKNAPSAAAATDSLLCAAAGLAQSLTLQRSYRSSYPPTALQPQAHAHPSKLCSRVAEGLDACFLGNAAQHKVRQLHRSTIIVSRHINTRQH